MAVVYHWFPDVCPPGGQCKFQVDGRPDVMIDAVQLCFHHAQLGLTKAETHRAILHTNMARERARWAIKERWMADGKVDKEYPGVPYVVDADGTQRIVTGENPARQATLRAMAEVEVARVPLVPGQSPVRVD